METGFLCIPAFWNVMEIGFLCIPESGDSDGNWFSMYS